MQSSQQRKSSTGSTPSITKRDFDEAVKQPWTGRKCIVAQFMSRIGMPTPLSMSAWMFAKDHGLIQLVQTFDKHWGNGIKDNEPMKKLRASLPIKVKL